MYSKIIIKTIGLKNSILKRLNPDDCLSDVRKELESSNTINDMLIFSKKIGDIGDEFIEVEREDEEYFLLKEIITDDKILYLNRLDWKLLNNQHKLDYGCIMSFDGIKKANKRAFTMKDCELTEIKGKGYKKDKLEFESKEDWIKKTNLFFSSDINVQNFVKLDESSHKKNFDDEIKSSYECTELGKVSLKFSKTNLILNGEFENDIKNAINSINPGERFKKITEEYGLFIPTEVILGGRVYLNGSVCTRLLGGIHPGDKEFDEKQDIEFDEKQDLKFDEKQDIEFDKKQDKGFDEKTWIKSLNNYQDWDCIELKSPINIFQLLPDDLCKEAYKSIGKKILCTRIKDYDYNLYESGVYGTFELNNDISQNNLEIIQNEEADYDIFATVVNTGKDFKKVFFNCQILKDQKAKPSIIIHGIQKKFRRRTYNLKIAYMIVGYDTHFNFLLSDITSVELIKKEYKSIIKREFDNIELQQEFGSMMASGIPFFGIPVLSNFDSSNNSIVIGHNFSSNQTIDIFSYNVKNNCYSKLPSFTFYILIIFDYSNTYTSQPFNYTMLKSPFIPLQSSKPIIPKYISLYLLKNDNDNYKPIFLKQKNKQIKVKYVDCGCKQTCYVCQNKTLKISKNEKNIDCILFDPPTR
ncbi:unnamed protein product [Rhizophagus irregularis]|uniref:DUF7431 domain-containing protein n=1 Tax=Rhizophagus irregularis TaxID=588596 RepID=A0A2N1NZ08_9GLOM|nr:hypothetical protein RhiirC2_842886 [Rhizophagus irregularis]CAB4376495.1 unnamed protein product [Rhizophagus irregularis]CAB5369792.1 unnamed protein product [Rhizophagus irregularis]